MTGNCNIGAIIVFPCDSDLQACDHIHSGSVSLFFCGTGAIGRDMLLQSRAELDSAHAAKRQLAEVQRQLSELERDLCRSHHTVHSRT